MPARAHVIWVVLLDALLVTVSILKQYRDYVSVQIEGEVYICLVLSHDTQRPEIRKETQPLRPRTECPGLTARHRCPTVA
jgi:hypothetical protein